MTNIYGVACYTCCIMLLSQFVLLFFISFYFIHMNKHVKVAPYLYFSNSFSGDEI